MSVSDFSQPRDPPHMLVDAGQMAVFVNSLFHYAEDGYVSFRAFDQSGNDRRPTVIRSLKLNGGGLQPIIDMAVTIAQDCANSARPSVFAPPVCTFSNPDRAAVADIELGLEIAVEVDEGDTDAACVRLQHLLGPATLIMASGGEWIDADTRQVFQKKHIHFRLSEPTRTHEDHAKLRHARDLAARLIGGDPTGKPVCHPLRWAGSVNRKAAPRLATNIESNPAAEVHLDEAVTKLEEAVEAAGLASVEMPVSSDPRAADSLIASAMTTIPNPGIDVHYDDWIRFGYAVYRATAGTGFAVFEEWSTKSDKFDAKQTAEAWRRIGRSILASPTQNTVGAGTIFWHAKQAGWTRPEPEPPADIDDPGYAEAVNADAGVRSGRAHKKAKGNQAKKTQPFDNRPEVEDLRALLSVSGKGDVLPTHANLLLILKHDPMVGGLVQYNAFSDDHMIKHPPPALHTSMPAAPGPYPRPWDGADVTRILAYAQQAWAPAFRKSTVEDCLYVEGCDVKCHPVREYLGALVWDKTPRLDTWLIKTFKCLDDNYHKAIGSKILIAAVRRVRQPGCKHDHMAVLEGKTGIGKSTIIAMLFGREWYTDQLSDITNKDAAIDLRGKWVVEMGEIEQIIKTDIEPVKAFLSRSFDHYRPIYGKRAIDVPRQGVLIGTTNAEEYLRDTTGNRRIWPIHCPTQMADFQWIEDNRDQLWAEAAHREANGESIWLDNDEVKKAAEEAQAERLTEDVWHERIAAFVKLQEVTKIADILTLGLKMDVTKQTKREQMRVADVLKALNWSRRTAREIGTNRIVKEWIKPEASHEGG